MLITVGGPHSAFQPQSVASHERKEQLRCENKRVLIWKKKEGRVFFAARCTHWRLAFLLDMKSLNYGMSPRHVTAFFPPGVIVSLLWAQDENAERFSTLVPFYQPPSTASASTRSWVTSGQNGELQSWFCLQLMVITDLSRSATVCCCGRTLGLEMERMARGCPTGLVEGVVPLKGGGGAPRRRNFEFGHR